MIIDNNLVEIGFCSICGAIHFEPEGFDEHRTCAECGADKVHSIQESMDIINDWYSIKTTMDILRYEDL